MGIKCIPQQLYIPEHDCETDARGSMTLAIYKDGACTKALIMDITTYPVKLYQSKGYNNYFKVQQQHHHQHTHGSTKVKTFTSPEDLDLFLLIYSIFFAETSGSLQKLVPCKKGMCFWTFLHRLYCV